MSLWQVFQEGGFIMYPLLICSVAMWAVVIEKFWGLGRFKRINAKLNKKAIDLIKEKKTDEAKGLYSQAPELIRGPYMALFESGKETDRVTRCIQETQLGLKKSLWILGTVGSSAPFIGLFGTVIGIIKSFTAIAETGKSGFSVVAAGLSEALVATAAGILVAVIAVIFYNYFLTRLSRLNLEFYNRLKDLSEMM